MNVLFAATEMAPFLKTGGLGDVIGALPMALRERGHSVSVVVPLFRGLRETMPELALSKLELRVPWDGGVLAGRVWMGTGPGGVRVFALERDEFFDRRGLYGGAQGDYIDNARRFGWFSRAVVELVRYIDPWPEILHLNDWQTGLAAAWVEELGLPVRTVFTIHNLAYQGVFPEKEREPLGLPLRWFEPDGVEFFGQLNFLKGGVVYADEITTVSPTYAQEIQTSQYGCGLDGVLRSRVKNLTGILNGIDVKLWDPWTNPHLKRGFSSKRVAGKKGCREHLEELCGWSKRPEQPIFACVSRLVSAKGFDLVMGILPRLVEAGGRLVVLGTGEPRFEEAFRRWGQRHPASVSAQIMFSEDWAQRIEAGADFFLMPSEMEPCGLNQMYSQRYGTVPIVHGVGGLVDSVQPWDEERGEGTGFVFKIFQTEALWQEIERAFSVFAKPKRMAILRKNGMEQDFSWERRVTEYEAVYARALAA
jgi:starch synthase